MSTPGAWKRESWELEASVSELPLKQAFTIATASWTETRNVFCTLRFAGVAGVGETSPDIRAEVPEDVVSELHRLDPSRLINPFNLEGVLELMPPGAARAAFDIALHDLAAKIAGLPLVKLLGLKARKLPPTSLTLAIGSPEEMVSQARALASYPRLKVKVGFEGDTQVLEEIRSFYGGILRLDANQGWDEQEAVSKLKYLHRLDIELVEQPIPRGNPDALARITSATEIPVFADEEVATAHDVARLKGVVDGVNLKLRKAGGIRETVRAVATARALGLKAMIGCDLDTGIAATAAATIASLFDYADLDGPLLLAEDPFPGLAYKNGDLLLPDRPGLGIEGAPV